MSVVSENITLDLTRQGVPIQVLVKQYDTDTRQLIVKVTNNGQSWTPTEGAVPFLEVTRPDGEADAFGLTFSGNDVLCVIPGWATQVDGEGFADIAFVYPDGSTISTMPFELIVVESGASLDNMQQNEAYSLLTTLVGSIGKIDEALDIVLEAKKELLGEHDITFSTELSDPAGVTVSIDGNDPIGYLDFVGKTFTAKRVLFTGNSIIVIKRQSGEFENHDAGSGYLLVLEENILVVDMYH